MVHPWEKTKWAAIALEEADLLNKDFKSASLNMLQELKKTKVKEQKETRTMKALQIEV